MKKVNQKSRECATTYTNCVEWAGADIPALGIETGDCLTDTVTKIAKKVVELAEPLDLSTLSLQCIVDTLGQEEPVNRSLSNILQLLIDNDCYLKELIDAIAEGNQEEDLILDLKCLASYDSFGNQNDYDLRSVLQGLINTVCDYEDNFSDINTSIGNLQDDVAELQAIEQYTEPAITSCLFTNKPTSQALSLLADAYCNYTKLVGDASKIQTAMGLFPVTDNIRFAATPGWTANITTLAELIGNMIIKQTANDDRITNIEDNCCQLDCDDIDLGFGKVIEDESLILIFNNIYGTNIPAAFTDCGSSYIIEDTKGNKVGGYLTIENNFVSDEISLVGLEKGLMITITITTKFCSEDGLSCQKCLSATMEYTGGCCIITNRGADDLTIVYSTPLTTL